jgi:tetratricopeptide (TPR) repeat protein
MFRLAKRFAVLPAIGVFLSSALVAQVATPAARSPQVDQFIVAIRTSLANQDLDKAIETAEAACKKEPSSSELAVWLGRAYGTKALSASVFTKFGWAKKCKKAFERGVELDPGSVEARMELLGYHMRAPGVVGGDKAIAWQQAEEISKRNAGWGHLARGQLFEQEKKADHAEVEYKAAVRSGPSENRFLLAFSSFLARNQRYKEAAAPWEERWKADPSDMVARYQLARLSLLAGTDLDKAVEHLTAYLQVPPKADSPTWADAQWRLGLVYEKMGKKENAVAALQMALKLDPKHQRAQKDLERIRKA